ncbi:MAG: spore coat associated protein CotJA [Ruminococcaceae bacterium]|nr:spore coat associated protein CotJA [Oscillospiraceae bacterium]
MERPYCEELPLAIASVPMQEFQKLYPPEVALERGTMFDELYLPFEGKECRRYDE